MFCKSKKHFCDERSYINVARLVHMKRFFPTQFKLRLEKMRRYQTALFTFEIFMMKIDNKLQIAHTVVKVSETIHSNFQFDCAIVGKQLIGQYLLLLLF